MKKNTLILLVVSMLAVFALSACGLVKEISAIKDSGEAFMTALKEGDASASWNILATNVQEEVGGEDAWAEFAAPRNFDSWTFNEVNVENGQGTLTGEATLGADTYTIGMIMDQEDGVWKISGLQFESKK
ncbi:MAG: hypothetical protein ACYDH2_12285 [Anaerolineaceae bacterium]